MNYLSWNPQTLNRRRFIFRPICFIRFETKYKNFGDEPEDKKGAWWYGDNVKSNLNGKHFNQQENNNDGIFWHSWKQYKTLKTVRMMIREGVSRKISSFKFFFHRCCCCCRCCRCCRRRCCCCRRRRRCCCVLVDVVVVINILFKN
jgi:hypothetical protein